MNIDDIVRLIGSVGFPIVCCGVLFWQQNKVMSDFANRIESVIDKLDSTTESNTSAVNSLVTTVEVIAKIKGDEK